MNILDKLRFHLRSHCDTLSDGWVVGCVQLVIKTKNFHYTKIFLMEETTWRRSYLSCNEHSSRMVNIPICIFCFYIIWISFTWNKIHTKRRNLVVDVLGLILVSAEHEKTYVVGGRWWLGGWWWLRLILAFSFKSRPKDDLQCFRRVYFISLDWFSLSWFDFVLYGFP